MGHKGDQEVPDVEAWQPGCDMMTWATWRVWPNLRRPNIELMCVDSPSFLAKPCFVSSASFCWFNHVQSSGACPLRCHFRPPDYMKSFRHGPQKDIKSPYPSRENHLQISLQFPFRRGPCQQNVYVLVINQSSPAGAARAAFREAGGSGIGISSNQTWLAGKSPRSRWMMFPAINRDV